MNSLDEKSSRIRLVLLDIDGVLTDGRIGYFGETGEVKFFDVKDGHALKLLRRAGFQVGLFSGRADAANRRRAAELDIEIVRENVKDKRTAFPVLLEEYGWKSEECLYMGDDLVDIPVIKAAGIGVAVADAPPEVRKAADWCTRASGGAGAVREVAVWLLKKHNKWRKVTERYLT